MRFTKYHGLGNDYLVVDAQEDSSGLPPELLRLLCHRNFGPGSDGVLLGPLPASDADFGLRIFNPDGSEAEKSGNGLRIFARFLFDKGLVMTEPFTVGTLGGRVRCRVAERAERIDVEMGTVRFDSRSIPVLGPDRDVVDETLEIGGTTYRFCAATIGNPHCVLPLESISESLARSLGPIIEVDPRFPHRTNVQFLRVDGRHDITIEIWERGAGYTLASGSSSCAAAAVARRLGLCDEAITVHMPGGNLDIQVHDDFSVEMAGPVARVYEGELDPEAVSAAQGRI